MVSSRTGPRGELLLAEKAIEGGRTAGSPRNRKPCCHTKEVCALPRNDQGVKYYAFYLSFFFWTMFFLGFNRDKADHIPFHLNNAFIVLGYFCTVGKMLFFLIRV